MTVSVSVVGSNSMFQCVDSYVRVSAPVCACECVSERVLGGWVQRTFGPFGSFVAQ